MRVAKPLETGRLHFLLMACCLLLGTCLALYQLELGAYSWHWLLLATAGFATLARLLRRQWLSRALLAAAIVCSGTLYTDLRLSHLAPRLLDQEQALTVSVLARVEDLPKLDGDRLSVQARTLESTAQLDSGSLLRLSWYRFDSSKAPPLAPGDCARFELRLRGTRGPVNAAGWDPERSALIHRWVARGSIRDAQSVACTGRWGLDRMRWDLAQRIDLRLQPGPERAAIKALSLGDTREFNDRDWEQLRRSGLSHLVAISGLHIGLLAGFGALLASALYRLLPRLAERLPRPQAQAVLALTFAATYAALAGFSLPTQRALIALAAFLAARLLRRALDVWSAYALALVAVLLIDPLAPLNAGFWLSFSAAGWLLYWFSRGGKPKPRWRSLLLAQAILACGLWPVTAAWFQHGSLAGPLLNLLVVPWVALVIVPLALLGVAALLLPGPIGEWLLQLTASGLSPLWWLLERLADWQISTSTAAPAAMAVVLALVGVAWLFAPYGTRFRFAAPILWLPLLWPRPLMIAPGSLQATVLDVGQGQAILLQTASHSALIDAGPGTPGGFDAGDALVVPSLRKAGVASLDLLLLSHGDGDHAGGRQSVVGALAPRALKASLPETAPPAPNCVRGDRWEWDGVGFEILHPPEYFPYLGNESSCVLRIEDAHGAVLLIPGDIGKIIEQRLAREQPDKLRANVLISPHHGSAGSSTSVFLTAVQPQTVIYSAGWGNRFQMPREEARARVAEVGAEQFSTARSGAIELISDGTGGYTVKRLRSEQARPWRAPDLGPYSRP